MSTNNICRNKKTEQFWLKKKVLPGATWMTLSIISDPIHAVYTLKTPCHTCIKNLKKKKYSEVEVS